VDTHEPGSIALTKVKVPGVSDHGCIPLRDGSQLLVEQTASHRSTQAPYRTGRAEI